MDVYPTLIELSGASVPAGQPRDGISLAALLADPSTQLEREALHWHLPHYHHSSPASAIRRGDWKLIEFFENGAVELYNLRDDRSEENNLAEQQPQRARELQVALAAWRAKVGAQIPKPNPNYDPARATELAKGKNKAS
jgi:uncharacterized sulfatase